MGYRFLDPACGSGNFLYVTLDIVKRIEVEVIKAISEMTGQHALRFDEVGPWQFHGIEISQWAREIADDATALLPPRGHGEALLVGMQLSTISRLRFRPTAARARTPPARCSRMCRCR